MSTKILKPKEALAVIDGGLSRLEQQISDSLAGQVDFGAFSRTALTCAQRTPALMEHMGNPRYRRDFFACVLQSAQLRLPPDPMLGWAWIIPRKIKGTPTPVFQLGYKGWLQLLWRSSMIRSVRSNVVREQDEYEWRDGRNFVLEHIQRPEAGNGKLVAAWAIIETVQGGEIPAWLWAWELKRLSSGRSSDIPDDQHWMQRKAAIVRAAKTGPISIEVQRSVVLEERADAGLDQGIAESVDVDWSVLDETEDLTPAEAFKLKHGAPEPEPEPIDDGDPKMLDAKARERIENLAGEQGVDRDRLDQEIAHLCGDADLERVPADHEQDIIKLIRKLAKGKR